MIESFSFLFKGVLKVDFKCSMLLLGDLFQQDHNEDKLFLYISKSSVRYLLSNYNQEHITFQLNLFYNLNLFKTHFKQYISVRYKYTVYRSFFLYVIAMFHKRYVSLPATGVLIWLQSIPKLIRVFCSKLLYRFHSFLLFSKRKVNFSNKIVFCRRYYHFSEKCPLQLKHALCRTVLIIVIQSALMNLGIGMNSQICTLRIVHENL